MYLNQQVLEFYWKKKKWHWNFDRVREVLLQRTKSQPWEACLTTREA